MMVMVKKKEKQTRIMVWYQYVICYNKIVEVKLELKGKFTMVWKRQNEQSLET